MSTEGLHEEPEFRHSTRALVVAPVEVDFLDNQLPESAYTANVSMSGLYIQTASPRPKGTKLQFELTLQDDQPPVEGYAEVIWSRMRSKGPTRPPGMGVKTAQLIGGHSEPVLKRFIMGAVKASGVTGEAVPAPALDLSVPEAQEALAIMRGEVEKTEAEREKKEVEKRLRPATRGHIVAPVFIHDQSGESPSLAYTANVSMSGLFVQTAKPQPVGNLIHFELTFQKDLPPVRGDGRVMWIRVRYQGPTRPRGMGIKIDHLVGEQSASVLRRIIVGAVKASEVTGGALPAPALDLEMPGAQQALARMRRLSSVTELKPVEAAAPDEVLARRRKRLKYGAHAARASELRLKHMTKKAIRAEERAKKAILRGDLPASLNERIRIKLGISRPGFLIMKLLAVVMVAMAAINMFLF